jgi:hypothetical protein
MVCRRTFAAFPSQQMLMKHRICQYRISSWWALDTVVVVNAVKRLRRGMGAPSDRWLTSDQVSHIVSYFLQDRWDKAEGI